MSKDASLPFRTTHRIRDTCMCLHLQRAARVVARRYDEALRPLDLTNGQFSLMLSCNRKEAPRVGEVSSLLGMDRTTVTAALKSLEKRGLVKVVVAVDDRRSRIVGLSTRGRKLLASAIPLWERAQAHTDRLYESDPQAFRTELRAVASTGTSSK